MNKKQQMINDYKYIRKRKRFKLNNWQLIQAHSFSLALIAFSIYLMISIFPIDYDKMDGEKLVVFSFMFIGIYIATIALAIHKKRTLAFIKLEIYPTPLQFQKSIAATANEMNWSIHNMKYDFVMATFRNRWKSKETQQVIILLDEDGVYMNSMTEISLLSFPFSVNRKESFIKFIRNLEYEIKGIDSQIVHQKKVRALEEAPEWSAYSMLKRLPAYFIILIWLAIGIGTFLNGEYGLVLLFSPLLALSAAYIYYDIKIIKDKAQKRKE
ncbi:MAG: hypothetical protein ACI94Y_003419 [Maribacter sp.]|jgi:hypothetical protein